MNNFNTTASASVTKWQNGAALEVRDTVAEEIPVALEYNGISHVVMLATPADLEDFALGFSMTEGILSSANELYSCEVVAEDSGVRLSLEISSERLFALKERRRALAGRTGCGLCGTETLSQAVCFPNPVSSKALLQSTVLHAALAQMESLQQLQHKTGATHAAAWLTADGTISLIREDIGRHNALDKLIGALIRAKTDTSTGAALVTSRASYEMAQKAACAGIGILAAVSAPTALAIRVAHASKMTLVGFARKLSHTVYTHPERIC